MMTATHLTIAALGGWLYLAGTAHAGEPALDVTIEGLGPTGRMADSAAFCPPPGSSAKDVSLGVTWSKGPPGTRSYAVLMTDPDVPADLGLIDRPGVVIADDAARMRVFHWVLADVPPILTHLPRGVDGDTLVPGGKPVGPTPHGRRGANVFTTFLTGTKDMAETYGGYDGPCPPSNDQRLHNHHVKVIALDVSVANDMSGFGSGRHDRILIRRVACCRRFGWPGSSMRLGCIARRS